MGAGFAGLFLNYNSIHEEPTHGEESQLATGGAVRAGGGVSGSGGLHGFRPGSATRATGAQAQANAAPLQEVVVTGSRLVTPNSTSISPITTVSATDIQATGLTRVEDILNNLPMVFAGENTTTSNGADGTATIDLRNLGNQRTLVLVDGLRLGPGAGDGRNFSDINQIPAALISSVQILTGGASSVYGADAVAGVVNFILDTHFEGVKIDAGYNFFQHSQDNPNGVQQAVSRGGLYAGAGLGRYRLRQERLDPGGLELCRQQGQRDCLPHLRQHRPGAAEVLRLQRLLTHRGCQRPGVRRLGHLGEERRGRQVPRPTPTAV